MLPTTNILLLLLNYHYRCNYSPLLPGTTTTSDNKTKKQTVYHYKHVIFTYNYNIDT